MKHAGLETGNVIGFSTQVTPIALSHWFERVAAMQQGLIILACASCRMLHSLYVRRKMLRLCASSSSQQNLMLLSKLLRWRL